jgi:hypothetical protein
MGPTMAAAEDTASMQKAHGRDPVGFAMLAKLMVNFSWRAPFSGGSV